MLEGIIPPTTKDDEIAEYLINDGYQHDVIPIVAVLSGSRAYGIHTEESDYDYLGLHLMDTNECLEHPDYRKPLQILRLRYWDSLEEVAEGEKGGNISLDSFEMWKFIDLLKKGSTVVYDLLFLPPIHTDPSAEVLLGMMRMGLTNKIGKSAKGHLFKWRKAKDDRKKTVLTYYRLLQALFFLREEEYEWQMEVLLDYMSGTPLVTAARDILKVYVDPQTRSTKLKDTEASRAALEIERLVEEVDRAVVFSRLPDYFPKDILEAILQKIKQTRYQLI